MYAAFVHVLHSGIIDRINATGIFCHPHRRKQLVQGCQTLGACRVSILLAQKSKELLVITRWFVPTNTRGNRFVVVVVVVDINKGRFKRTIKVSAQL